jgi:hypothetical protein
MASKSDKAARASLRKAFIRLAAREPHLLVEAFKRGLLSGRPLGYLELGARLLKEIGSSEDASTKIAIVFQSPLDSGKLRDGAPAVHVIEARSIKALTDASESPQHGSTDETGDQLQSVSDS